MLYKLMIRSQSRSGSFSLDCDPKCFLASPPNFFGEVERLKGVGLGNCRFTLCFGEIRH